MVDGNGWSTARPCRFNPGTEPVANLQEGMLAPGTAWTDAENLAATGIFFIFFKWKLYCSILFYRIISFVFVPIIIYQLNFFYLLLLHWYVRDCKSMTEVQELLVPSSRE